MMTYGLLIPGLLDVFIGRYNKIKEKRKKGRLRKRLRSYRSKRRRLLVICGSREVATTNATVAALAIIGQLEGYKPIDDSFLFTGYAG